MCYNNYAINFSIYVGIYHSHEMVCSTASQVRRYCTNYNLIVKSCRFNRNVSQFFAILLHFRETMTLLSNGIIQCAGRMNYRF